MPTAPQPSASSANRSLRSGATGHLPASALVACAAILASSTLPAQTHKVAAPDSVTRAVAVYEWTGDLAKPDAARLVPVSLFINSQFEDGGTYYARPIPLALLNGNVYSLEKSGIPTGNVTLDYARHLQTATNAGTDDSTDLGWFGYGTFANLAVAKKAAPLRASRTTSEIVSSKDPDRDADRPTFAKRSPTATKPDESRVDPPPSAKSSSTAPAAPDDPDRPHLSKPKASTTTPDPTATPTSTSPAATTTPAPDVPDTKPPVTSRTDTSKPDADDADRPTLRHRDPKQAEADRRARNQSTVIPVPGSLNNDPDRPTMKRGKTPEQKAAAQLTGLPAALHQSIAVSDAVNRENHDFARAWSTPTERAETLTKLEALAQREVATFVRTNNAAPPSTSPAPKPVPRTHRTAAVKPLNTYTAPLTNESITPLTLSYGGLPTFVYTAISPASASPAPERYVTLVAQQVPSGEFQVAFSSVTDAAHLDRTPWFRFVDAVDPDGSHRASLLFELRSQHSRQFALYNILTAKADQTFLTRATD